MVRERAAFDRLAKGALAWSACPPKMNREMPPRLVTAA
jgi:hypothetical protein